jgi:4-amino-4-deoxy-L-arabinose transferase-like glycosyltransferase
MSDVSISIAPTSNARDGGVFALAFTAEEKSKDGLLRAICLRATFVSLLAYALYSAVAVTALAIRMVPNQWENTYPEVPPIFAAIRTVATGHLYYPFTQPPYVLQQYGLLFYELSAWIARIAHSDIDRFIFLSRITSLAAFFICGVLVFAVCRRQKFSAPVSLTAAVLPMGVPLFCPWAVTVRPDMYFLALMLGSLALALWNESPQDGICIAAGALGGMAFLMKQPGVAVLIAIGAVWLLHKKVRQTALLAAGALIAVAVMLALLLIHREPFLGQYLSIGKALRSFGDARVYTWALLGSPTRLLPIGIGAIGLVPAFASERGQMIASFTLLNWFVGLAGMPQVGAGSNYFLAGFLGCGLLLPFALELVRKNANFAPVTLVMALGIGYIASGYSIGAVFNGVNMNPHPF